MARTARQRLVPKKNSGTQTLVGSPDKIMGSHPVFLTRLDRIPQRICFVCSLQMNLGCG